MNSQTSDLLSHKTRENVFLFIQDNPGVHLREIQKNLQLPLTTINHHIKILCANNLICKLRDGKYSRFYTSDIDDETHLIVSALRKKRKNEIISTIISQYSISFKDLRTAINVRDSTLSHHLRHLIDDGIIRKEKIGKENRYRLKNRERVCEIYSSIQT